MKRDSASPQTPAIAQKCHSSPRTSIFPRCSTAHVFSCFSTQCGPFGPALWSATQLLISAPARWSPIGRCRGDYAPTIAAGDCIGEEVPVGHRRRRNGVVGAIHRRGDVREVREGGGRGAARGVGVGWEARRREAAALEHTGDAARRGHGEGAHPVRLGSTSGRRVGAASADQ